MEPEDREAFLQRPRAAVFSTIGSTGRIHSVLVWYLWDGKAFTVVTDRGSVKQRNAERAGRATIVVHEDVAYLSAEGPVAVKPAAIETRLALWTRYKGEDVARTTVTPEATAKMVELVLRPARWIEVPASFLDR
jgi:PPOX class probable F420-dependent enzyme